MDAFRRQLDQLMGANRNGDVQEVSRKYYDRDVCRMFLVGLCPHELFQLTVRSIQYFLYFPPFLLFRDCSGAFLCWFLSFFLWNKSG